MRSIPKCEISPLVIFKGLYKSFARRLSVIHPNGAESNSQLVLPFGIRLRNLNSQSNRDQPFRSVAIISCVSRACLDSKAGRALVYESTDYVCKVERVPNINCKVTVGGFYGSSSLYDRVLKREGQIVYFSTSSNSHCRIGYCFRAFILSPCAFFIFKNNKLLNPISALNYTLVSKFFHVSLTSCIWSSLAKNNGSIFFTTTFSIKFLTFPHSCIKFLLFKYKIKNRSHITQQFIHESAERLKNINIKKKNNKYIELTKDFLTDPNFLVLAYLQIKGKPGNMTAAVNNETLDGISRNWFINGAFKIKNNSYKFKSAKMVNIPKNNSSELRSLTIGSPRDKIVQKAIQLIINQIYEYEDKIFLNISHGFRANFSCHTAIKQIKTTWSGLYWFIEADIEKAFDRIQRNILIKLLEKKIKDQRLFDLIRKMFNCNILSLENFYFKRNKGVPQGNVLSPLLCNIYLHELDLFMQNLKEKYDKGSFPTKNEEFFKELDLNKYERALSYELQNRRVRSKRRELFNKGIKPYLHDGNFIRVRYIRYADDFLIGVRGPKLVAEKIKNEVTYWLKSNLHLNLKKEKTKLTYSIGNKINFLGFNFYRKPYSQSPYRNSRRIEKAKRIKVRLLAEKDRAKKKLEQQLRLNLTKAISQNLRENNTKSVNYIIKELSKDLISSLGADKITSKSSYRAILRELERKLSDVILNDTNKNLKKLFSALFKPEYLEPVKYVSSNHEFSMERDTTLITKSKLSEAEFARRFTELLKENGFEHYKLKDIRKIRFDKNVIKYLRESDIKLTYYPTEVVLDETLRNQLVKVSKTKPKRGALANNYKILINYFWDLQNKMSPELRITKEQSQQSKFRIVALESQEGVLMDLPFQIRVDWRPILEKLTMKGVLNKKGRPASVARLMTLCVSDIIKYFNSVLVGYLSYYRCADDFKAAKSRFYWYLKYSLVSSLKAKFKMGSRRKVFERYGQDITYVDRQGKEVSFSKWEDVKKLTKTYLVNCENKPHDRLKKTWITTQSVDFFFYACAVEGCRNTDIELHHLRNLYRDVSNNITIIQGRKKKLYGWQAIYSAQKAKQLPLCSKHHKMLHSNKLKISDICESFLVNIK